jgi:hypothetical protein
VVAPAAPLLVGPLDLDGVTGEGSYLSSLPARHYWSLTASGTSPTASEIAAGTGAYDYGHFDAPAGSVQADIVLRTGISAPGAVFSIVARIEPGGTWSNILRDTSVDVDTAQPITRALVGVSSPESSATPSFGTLAAGEYILVVLQRAGTITSVTPPGQSAVTTPIISAPVSTTHLAAIYRVTLTAQRSGNWAITSSGAVYTTSVLYSLSGASQTIATVSDTVVNGTKTTALTANTQAGDIIIAASNNGGGGAMTAPADDAGDPVTSDATSIALSEHRWRVWSGAAAGGTPETIITATIGNAFKNGVLAAVVLRRA